MYDAYGLDPDLVTFSDSRPDLLMVVDGEHGPEIRVVDLKASDFMKLSHRIQVGIYTLLLGHMLRAEGLDHFHLSRVGGVWLYQAPEPEWFPLSSIIPPIEAFLERELTDLLTTPAGDVFWHLYYRCEWCDFYQHCRGEAERTDGHRRRCGPCGDPWSGTSSASCARSTTTTTAGTGGTSSRCRRTCSTPTNATCSSRRCSRSSRNPATLR
jgi:hypothetical protein